MSFKGLLGYFVLTLSGVAVMPDVLRLSLGLLLMAVALSGLAAFTGLKFWLEPKFYRIRTYAVE